MSLITIKKPSRAREAVSNALGLGAIIVLFGAFAAMLNFGATVASDFTEEYGSLSVGPGYVENIANLSCPDAGAEIATQCMIESLSCECDQATLFGHDSVIPTTGRAETNFDGNVRRGIKCRSQTNSVCDCWALCSNRPQ